MLETFTTLINNQTHGTTTHRLQCQWQSIWLQITIDLRLLLIKSIQLTLLVLNHLQESNLPNLDNHWFWKTPTTNTQTSRIGITLKGTVTLLLISKRLPQIIRPKMVLQLIRHNHKNLTQLDSLWLLTTWRREMHTRILIITQTSSLILKSMLARKMLSPNSLRKQSSLKKQAKKVTQQRLPMRLRKLTRRLTS